MRTSTSAALAQAPVWQDTASAGGKLNLKGKFVFYFRGAFRQEALFIEGFPASSAIRQDAGYGLWGNFIPTANADNPAK